MKHAVLLALLAALGCAHTPTPREGVDLAGSALAGVGLAVEASKPVVDTATTIRIEQCRAESTPEGRARCLGALGEPVAPIYKQIGSAYDNAVDAIAELRAAVIELERVLEEARATGGGGR